MSDHDERSENADLDELRDLMARAQPNEVEWEAPPAGLWARISEAIGIEPPAAPEPATVLPNRSRRRWIVASAVAAAAAAVLVIVTIAAIRGDDDASRVVSAIELEPLGPSGSGSAELVDRDGSLQLRVETSGLDAGDGYLELWLIDPTVTQLVSLGPLRDDGVYDVPAGVDPAAFPIVDVSVEPVDGDPTHSGDSVLRGQLPL